MSKNHILFFYVYNIDIYISLLGVKYRSQEFAMILEIDY